MTFEEYEEKHLHDLNHEARRLVRMGWNARGKYVSDIGDGTSQAARAQGAEPVAWSWENRGMHVTVDKKFADELISDGETVCPLVFGDTQPPAKPESVPEGWKLVPVEPTEEMRDAARAAYKHGYSAVYRETLAAAPPADKPENVQADIDSLLKSVRTLLDKLPTMGNPIDGHAAEVEEWYERITDPLTAPQAEGRVKCSDHPPAWSDAPNWANWLARDAGGEWYWFEHKPSPENEGWDDSMTLAENCHEIAKTGRPCDCWRQSLQKRPQPPAQGGEGDE